MHTKRFTLVLSAMMTLSSLTAPAFAQEDGMEETFSEINFDVNSDAEADTAASEPASENNGETEKSIRTGEETLNVVKMYRLYNPNSGEHFYTSDTDEWVNLNKVGWNDEGIGWTAPARSNSPVYRLYNANAGDHHYTMNKEEKDHLVKVGWKYEGIGWYSSDQKEVPMYRQYNPNAVTGTHNYTSSKTENDSLVKAGWRAENIGWYGTNGFDWSGWYQSAYMDGGDPVESCIRLNRDGTVLGYNLLARNSKLHPSKWTFYLDELTGSLVDFKQQSSGYLTAKVNGSFWVPMEIGDLKKHFDYILEGNGYKSYSWPTIMWQDDTVHIYKEGTKIKSMDRQTQRIFKKASELPEDSVSRKRMDEIQDSNGVLKRGIVAIINRDQLFVQYSPIWYQP